MKLKKILASLTAAALAATTMAFAPVSVSAADYVNLGTGSIGETTLVEDSWNPGKISKPSITLDNKWGNPFSVSGYDRIEVDYTCGNTADVSNLYLVAQNGTINWHQKAVNPEASGTITLDLSGMQEKTYEAIVFLAEPTNSFSVGASFNPQITVTESRLYSNDTTEYAWQTIDVPTPEPESTYNYKLPGKFISDNISGSNAGIEITYVTDGSDWGGFNLVNNAGGNWTKISSDFGTAEAGSNIQFVKFSELTGSLPSDYGEFFISAYNGAYVSSIRIKNEASKGNVYYASTPATGITLSTTEINTKLGEEASTITAEITPDDTTDTIEWLVEGDAVEITASANGLSCTVTPKAVGTATITAKANETVSAACAVKVADKDPEKYNIIIAETENGTVAVKDGITSAAKGTVIELIVTPDTGYELDTLTVNDAAIEGLSFTMPEENVSVKATFKKSDYTITVKTTENGTVAVKDGITSAAKDTVIELIVTPDTGYELDTLTVNDKAIEGLSFTMPEENVSVKATFKKSDYTVTVKTTAGGTAKADKETAQYGDTVSIIDIAPKEGFILGGITVNGKAIEGTSFEMPAQNVDVLVKFVSESGISSFVERLYTTMLGRESEEEGKADWTKQLNNGATATDVAKGFVLSQELANQKLSNEEFVTRMYRTFMDREPDAEGLANWVKALDGGCSYAYILNSFVLSEEFGNICNEVGIETGRYEITEARDKNRNLTAFVSRMYTKALGRQYEVGGLNTWTERILTGDFTLDAMAHGFIFSDELNNKELSDDEFMDTLYATFFDREPDEEGKADWLNRMHDKGWTRVEVLDGFLGAEEFGNLVKTFELER